MRRSAMRSSECVTLFLLVEQGAVRFTFDWCLSCVGAEATVRACGSSEVRVGRPVRSRLGRGGQVVSAAFFFL